MPFYDIARSQRLPSELRAMQIANRQGSAQARITEQSADYYEDTGTSEASQKDVGLSIDAGNLGARWGELNRGLAEDERKAADSFIDKVGAVQQFIELGGSEEDAAGLYDTLIQSNRIPAGNPISRFDPRTVKALATASQITDRKEPISFMNVDTEEVVSVDPQDKEALAKVIGPNWVRYSATTQTTALPRTEAQNLRSAEVNTRGFLSTASNALKLLKNAPSVNTLVGRAASIFNTVRAEYLAFADEAGFAPDALELLSPDTWADDLTSLGINSDRMRSLVVSLAFQAAKTVAEAAGRDVSNTDVVNFMKQIGAKTSSPQAFSQVLMDVSRQVDELYRINYKVRTGDDFTDDLGLTEMEELYPADSFDRPAEAPRARSQTVDIGNGRTVEVEFED